MQLLNQKKELLIAFIVSILSTILIYIVLFILSGFLLISALFDHPNNIFLMAVLFILSFIAYFTLPDSDTDETSQLPDVIDSIEEKIEKDIQ